MYIYIYIYIIQIQSVMYMKFPFSLVKQHGKTKKQGSAWPPPKRIPLGQPGGLVAQCRHGMCGKPGCSLVLSMGKYHLQKSEKTHQSIETISIYKK